jgi:hypothetical protein
MAISIVRSPLKSIECALLVIDSSSPQLISALSEQTSLTYPLLML